MSPLPLTTAARLFRLRGRRRRHHQARRADDAPPAELVVVGLDHTTAPIELRERLAFADAELPAALSRLTNRLFDQAVILSTCNRVELYGVARSLPATHELASFLALDRGVETAEVESALYCFRGDQAAHRLAATAAGLHSLVLGEAQIQGQVRRALEHALVAGTAGPELRRMFESAIAAGRRVRSRTALGRGPTSVPGAGVELADRRLGTLAQAIVLLIGTGKTGQLAAKQLAARGVKRLLVSGRDQSRAERLAELYGGHAIALDRLAEAAAQADVVITASGATEPILRREHLRPRPLLVIDLSVPRNVDPAVPGLAGVEVHTVDDLRATAEHALEQRRAQLPEAHAILEDEVARFTAWLRRREALARDAAGLRYTRR